MKEEEKGRAATAATAYDSFCRLYTFDVCYLDGEPKRVFDDELQDFLEETSFTAYLDEEVEGCVTLVIETYSGRSFVVTGYPRKW